MPTNGTPKQTFRMDQETWDRFGEAVGDHARAEAVRAFIRWVLREDGGKLSKRVPPPPRPESMGRTDEGDRGDDSSHSRA